jgi:1,2-diacylglycerol 3-alpha-glucosyltransferase
LCRLIKTLMHLVVFFDNFGPYHLARLAALQALGEQEGFAVSGLETLATSVEYDWTKAGHDCRNIITLFSGSKHQHPLGPTAVPKVWETLNHLQPDALAICGYNGIVPLTALIWAKAHGKITVMMSETSYHDKSRSIMREWGKSQIVRRFDAAVVGGRGQKDYTASLGIPLERIFIGYDVVDNEHFARGAAQARAQENNLRRRYGLPSHYFLSVSRFIAKKNLPLLIDAYARYRKSSQNPWGLVLCGSGPMEAQLKEQARDVPGIHFPGFMQAQELPLYYGLASVFILPSSHFEQWGLVVNEAMACGLPVLVSRACGCAPDLVQEGINGYTFDPQDVDLIAGLLMKMSGGEVNLPRLGAASRQLISAYSPEAFAANLLLAIRNSLAGKGGRP